MLPVLGTCAAAELVLVVDGADQFPKRDFTPGWAAGCVVVVVMELVEDVQVGVLVKPGKTDVAAVVLLVDPPNIEDVLLEETVEAGLEVVRGAGCPKPALAVAPPKMGLKVWTGGLLSGTDVAGVVVTEKMGLNPEAGRGFVLVTDSELLAGAVVAVPRLEDVVGAERGLFWLVSPKRAAPVTGGVLLEDFMT